MALPLLPVLPNHPPISSKSPMHGIHLIFSRFSSFAAHPWPSFSGSQTAQLIMPFFSGHPLPSCALEAGRMMQPPCWGYITSTSVA